MYEHFLSLAVDLGWISEGGWMARGGVVMPALLACSIVALAATMDRLANLRRRVVLRPEPARVLADLGEAGDAEEVRELARDDGAVGRLLAVAIDHADSPRDLLHEIVRDAGRREVQRLERNLGLLSMVGGVAPLLGLLGTVLGMIRAFDALHLGGSTADPALLAGGISEALLTTGVGLMVAIPALLAHHLLLGRVDRLATDLEETAVEIVAGLASPQPEPTPDRKAPAAVATIGLERAAG